MGSIQLQMMEDAVMQERERERLSESLGRKRRYNTQGQESSQMVGKLWCPLIQDGEI